MIHLRRALALAGGLMLAACVTINVYFPAAEARDAADRVIDDVWGDDAQDEARTEEGGGSAGLLQREARLLAAGLSGAFISTARAAADVDISSPAARRIISRMEDRHGALRAYYDSGAVGLTSDAQVEVRDLGAVPLPERNRVRSLVAEENTDRRALYQEIARANEHPEWEPEIRDIFAKRWIAKAKSGWWYQGPGGAWVQK